MIKFYAIMQQRWKNCSDKISGQGEARVYISNILYYIMRRGL